MYYRKLWFRQTSYCNLKNSHRIRLAIAIIAFGFLLAALISLDAFEWLHGFTRSHEDWELDELIVIVISGLVVLPVWAAVELKVSRDDVRTEAADRIALEQELSTARRGQAMGSLAGGMAHSGNNMLQAILTLGRTMQSRLPPNDPNHELVEKIIRAASQASDTFTSVLRLSRSERLSADIIDFGDCLLRNQGVLGTTIAINLNLQLRVIATGVAVPISEAECTDIMLVLLSNASDAYQGKPGNITVDVTKGATDKKILKLAVCDKGSGISEQDQVRIFDPFYTTKPAGEGAGIGLAVVKRIVERAGGTISFESNVNEGTTFVIQLPIVERLKT